MRCHRAPWLIEAASTTDMAWLATFTSSATAVDCISWTNNPTNANGYVIDLSPPLFLTVQCNTSHAIACCD
jgi:hypothetical protein